MPRGIDYKIPLADLLRAAEEHQAGFSLRSIATRRWEAWGYASMKSALEGLRHALHAIDAPVRDRIEATVQASTIHGNNRRQLRAASDPRWREYRRWQRRRHRIKLGLPVRPPATSQELADVS